MPCGKLVGIAVLVGLSVWIQELIWAHACDQINNSVCSGFIVQSMCIYVYTDGVLQVFKCPVPDPVSFFIADMCSLGILFIILGTFGIDTLHVGTYYACAPAWRLQRPFHLSSLLGLDAGLGNGFQSSMPILVGTGGHPYT